MKTEMQDETKNARKEKRNWTKRRTYQTRNEQRKKKVKWEFVREMQREGEQWRKRGEEEQGEVWV